MPLGTRETRIFQNFRLCGMCVSVCVLFVGFLMIVVRHIAFPYGFLLKSRCVPKIGFSADISIRIFIDISINASIDSFIDISIALLTEISIDMFTGISIGFLYRHLGWHFHLAFVLISL